jgi:D-aminopeptidase
MCVRGAKGDNNIVAFRSAKGRLEFVHNLGAKGANDIVAFRAAKGRVFRIPIMNTGPARDFGIPFDGDTGRNNAITDVEGVWVGQTTLNQAPSILSGVTAILPSGGHKLRNGNPDIDSLVFAACFDLNGNGEMTGTKWIEESGLLRGPIMLTNTVSVGVVRNEVITFARQQLGREHAADLNLYMPVVAETFDGAINDILGPFPAPGTYPNPGVVAPADVVAAINSASPDAPEQGNVGGGTGMTCYDWKGGIGTSSRTIIPYPGASAYTVGVLVQANQGDHFDLVVRGAPVGREMTPPDLHHPPCNRPKSSVIVVIGTDAPLLPHQLKRLARRAALGVGRTGTYSKSFSGEIFVAFSTANKGALLAESVVPVQMLPNDDSLDGLFWAAVEATEEAILNAMIAAKTVHGRTGVSGIPRDTWGITDLDLPATTKRLADVMKKYNRWVGP